MLQFASNMVITTWRIVSLTHFQISIYPAWSPSILKFEVPGNIICYGAQPADATSRPVALAAKLIRLPWLAWLAWLLVLEWKNKTTQFNWLVNMLIQVYQILVVILVDMRSIFSKWSGMYIMCTVRSNHKVATGVPHSDTAWKFYICDPKPRNTN